MLIGITIDDTVATEYKELSSQLGVVLSDRIQILMKQDIPVLKELIKKQRVM